MTATRETILHRAVETFAMHGFEGASTARIARECGVTQPLVHYHFASKENLWREAVDHLFGRVHAEFAELGVETTGESPRALLRAFMRRFVYQCAEQPAIAQIVLREGMARSARFDWLVERHLRPLITGVSALFAHALSGDGKERMPPLHLIFVAMGGANLIFSAPAFFEAIAGQPATAPEAVAAHADAMVAVIDRILGDV